MRRRSLFPLLFSVTGVISVHIPAHEFFSRICFFSFFFLHYLHLFVLPVYPTFLKTEKEEEEEGEEECHPLLRTPAECAAMGQAVHSCFSLLQSVPCIPGRAACLELRTSMPANLTGVRWAEGRREARAGHPEWSPAS